MHCQYNITLRRIAMYLHITYNIGLIFYDGKFLQARVSEDDVQLLSSQMLWPLLHVFVVAKHHPHYDHFCALISGEKQPIKEYASSDIHDDCCVCHAHHREAKQHQSDPEYIRTRKRGIKAHSTIQHIHFGMPHYLLNRKNNSIP